MILKLVVKSKASCEPEELLLRERSHGLGRMHDNDLSIQVDCVSGYHAELKRITDGGYAICDLNSTNGTFLNDRRVTSPVRVKPGDQLKLGDLLIAVEEDIEVVPRTEDNSYPGGYPFKVFSLKDEFDFSSDESFYTFPITPIRTTPPAIGNVGEVLKHGGRIEDPDPESGIAAQQLERAREAERAQQIERAREAERAQQLERAREAERAQQIERARETQRAQQFARAQETERAQQLERAHEAERAQQLERAREAERAQQIERAREAERAQQLERAREAERAQQIERARETQRAQQFARAQETERAQQLERAREAQQAAADLRQQPEPAGRENFGSKVQSLTAQLESAMREIMRLKASNANESPRTAGMNGHAAVPANPSQPTLRGREDQAIQRSGNSDLRSQLPLQTPSNPAIPHPLTVKTQSPSPGANDPKPRADHPAP
ncbi:MAG: FHA domain-containing protein [Verrucomicrobiales bacterium]|nr:FHA domain-containing protein [Verrucomicrobiales bacterium]